MSRSRLLVIAGVLILLWGGFSIAAYFVAHKPFIIQFINPISSALWSLILAGTLAINALSIGSMILRWFIPNRMHDTSRIILAGGMGLGVLGLLGFGMATLGITSVLLLLVFHIALFALLFLRGEVRQALIDSINLIVEFRDSARHAPAWMRWATIIALTLTFLRTLLPPIEAFDALLYHLTIPELWIRDGGLRAYNFPHYWFPGLVEGVFVWGLGLGSEIVPQQMHLFWTVLLALLIWYWARALWGDRTSWWALMILISLPSLLLLASWAYTDMALTFYGVETLYCIWLGAQNNNTRWWIVSGVFAGFAMGIKYTSFVIPVSAVIIIAILAFRQPREMFRKIARFSAVSIIAGSIWYIRNWIWMGNPFYPFAFGGRFWDPFRAAAFSGAGTGIGLDWAAILSLPLTITLGYQDANYFDGNIGPLFLVTLPISLVFLFQIRKQPQSQRQAVGIILVFTLISIVFWVYGYITTRNLWQTRLLIPALVPFIIIAAAGLMKVRTLDTPRFRPSFILYSLAALSIVLTLFDATLSVIDRNPLAIAAGIVPREEYFEKFQPAYFHALELIARAPTDAKLLSLFEPRTYGSSRDIQPDPILDRFPHDLFLFKTPAAIVQAWREEGYTHVLVNTRGAEFIYGSEEDRVHLLQTLDMLNLIDASPEGEYSLYRIPPP